MRYLFFFQKGDACRWLGHLDILRTFERAVRRADLPIAFSAGFNPHEKLSFASALPVGVTGAREPAIVELTESIEPSELVQRLNAKLPPGIQVQDAMEIADAGHKDLMNGYNHAVFRLLCVGNDSSDAEVRAAVDSINAATSLPVERTRDGKRRTVELRTLVVHIQFQRRIDDKLEFVAVLLVSQDGSARTGEIVELLSRELPGLTLRRAHRDALVEQQNWNSVVAAAQHSAGAPA